MQLWLESLEGRVYLEDVGIDGRMILKRTLEKYEYSVRASVLYPTGKS